MLDLTSGLKNGKRDGGEWTERRHGRLMLRLAKRLVSWYFGRASYLQVPPCAECWVPRSAPVRAEPQVSLRHKH